MDIETKDEVLTNEEVSQMSPDALATLKATAEEQFEKIRNQAMILGFRVACATVMDRIEEFERSPGKKSNNDHKRLIKNIKQFAEQGLARKMNENGEIVTSEETEV